MTIRLTTVFGHLLCAEYCGETFSDIILTNSSLQPPYELGAPISCTYLSRFTDQEIPISLCIFFLLLPPFFRVLGAGGTTVVKIRKLRPRDRERLITQSSSSFWAAGPGVSTPASFHCHTQHFFSLTQAWSRRPQRVSVLQGEGIPCELSGIFSVKVCRKKRRKLGGPSEIGGQSREWGARGKKGLTTHREARLWEWWNHGARDGWHHVIHQWEFIPNPHTKMTHPKVGKRLSSMIWDMPPSGPWIRKTPNHYILPLKWFSASSPASKSFAYHYEDFCPICEPSALLIAKQFRSIFLKHK